MGGGEVFCSSGENHHHKDMIRPILDVVDKLRHLNITLPLPTIVVIGDQSSGKSSVLESLAGVSLPRGKDTCTRAPLIMRLQHHPDLVPEFLLEFQNKSVTITKESQIPKAIDAATVEIAGNSKCISDVPLTLVVKKKGIPNITMVDLPGIVRLPIGDQPDNIFEQISGMIMEYIKPEESIILNVLSASVELTSCASIRMSLNVDNTFQRTLAVVTKCDQYPDGDRLLKRVITNAVNIGLGCVCVRNKINDETYDEARNKEANLFENHPLLSMIDKSMVGIPVLAQRLVQIQSVIISKCLPDMVNNINERLNSSTLDLNKLPRNFMSIPDAIVAFMQIVGSFKETLQKIIIRGEHDDYENDKQMHFNARLAEMVDKLSKDLQSSVNFSENFMVEEMNILEETNGIGLPHFLPHSVFLSLLKRKVDNISNLPISFVNKVCGYLEIVCFRVLTDCCGNYPQLLPSMKKATQHVIGIMKTKLIEGVDEMIEIERTINYTSDPEFIIFYNKLMGERDQFFKSMSSVSCTTTVEGYGTINTKHLINVPLNTWDQAFDLKMRITAYWKIVIKRMVECLALKLRFFTQKMVNKEMEAEIVNEVMVHGGSIEKMLDELPSLAKKREQLESDISLLKESKKSIEQIMDGIVVTPHNS